MSLHRRKNLAEVPAYRQGRPAPEGASKLSSNESPHTPLPSVQAVIAEQVHRIHLYPNMGADEVRGVLAARHDVPVECVTVGAGSIEVASQIIHASAGEGDEVMFAWRSFEAYPSLVRIAGATPVQVPLDSEARHDLDAMLAAITPNTRLIFICNPNNPTGTVVDADKLRAFVDAVPRDILVVIDEAYVHYDLSEHRADGIELFHEFPHVAVLHSFSKAYGLAGLRIGYAVSPVEFADELRKVAVPFGVTSLAQDAAVASLAAEDELAVRIAEVTQQRARLSAALEEWGYSPTASQGNFVWIPAGCANGLTPTEVGEHLDAGGIIARIFPEDGVRISAGSVVDTDRTLAALAPAVHTAAESATKVGAEF